MFQASRDARVEEKMENVRLSVMEMIQESGLLDDYMVDVKVSLHE
jgi:hypothetical protein